MLYSTIIVAASAFAGFASAQNTTSDTPIPCCSVAASSVSTDDRQTWCQANQNTCVELCGGQGKLASNGNKCDTTTLEYQCKCSNGTDVADAMPAYQQTVPGLMCRTWYGQCIAASGEDAAQQFACNQARDTQCGNLTTSDATDAGNGVAPSGSSSSGSSSSPTSSGAMSSSTESAASSASSAAPASGAANLAMYGSSALVGGLLAVFGLAL